MILRMTFWLSTRLFELYWSFDKLLYVEMEHRSGSHFWKLYMKTTTKTKKHLAEKLKTSYLCNQIICRPSQSRETIPLIEFEKRSRKKKSFSRLFVRGLAGVCLRKMAKHSWDCLLNCVGFLIFHHPIKNKLYISSSQLEIRSTIIQ